MLASDPVERAREVARLGGHPRLLVRSGADPVGVVFQAGAEPIGLATMRNILDRLLPAV